MKNDRLGAGVARKRARGAAAHLERVSRRERDTYLDRAARLGVATIPVNLPPIVLAPIRISPDALVENRPAYVEFYVWNRAGGTLENVFVRARVQARHSLDTYDGLFNFDIRSLGEHQTVSGAISFTLPRADLHNKLILELCRWGDIPPGGEFPELLVLASAELEFDVAARFSVQWTSIHIRDTAARHEDTLFVSFNGLYDDKTWGDSAHLGNHNNTGRGGILPEVLPVGPFDVLPSSGRAVAFSVVIANAGHTSEEEDAKKALKVVSTVGAATATTIMSILFPIGAAVWAALSAAVDLMHQAIIDWALADCDTVVMNDGRLISEEELFLSTFDPHDSRQEAALAAWTLRSQKKAGEFLADVLGPGCRDSDYSVTFAVRRHRIPEMIHTSDGVRLSPSQKTSFAITGAGIQSVTFDAEIGKVEFDGDYKAPDHVTDRKYDVVKWTVHVETKHGIEDLYSDFAIVLLD